MNITHMCPPDGSGILPCCGRTPFEVNRYDRLTEDVNLVNCWRPRLKKANGEVILLRNGVETDVEISDSEIEFCLEPIQRIDYAEAQRRCQLCAVQHGLPATLPDGKRYSFGDTKMFTVVPL